MQSAYQVLVASSEATLARDRGDLWDSGKVVSGQSVHVVYAGRPLTSRAVCYWKVRVWDQEGRVSSWSAPARWEMALVEPGDWTASWVNDGKPNPASDEAFYENDPAPLFRHEFALAAPVRRARLYVTGLGYYEAFLNGARVGDQVLDPGWTMYGKRVFYSTYDVTSQIRQGRNCVGVTLGNGWYNPLPLRMWGQPEPARSSRHREAPVHRAARRRAGGWFTAFDRERRQLAGGRRAARVQQRLPGRGVRRAARTPGLGAPRLR